MRKLAFGGLVLVGLVVALSVGSYAIADNNGHTTRLGGYFEVPAVSTTGKATLRLRLDERNQRLEWNLAWRDLEVSATQAHIHFGQRDVNGAIVVFFCTNLGNAPAAPVPPTQACPVGRSGELSGVFTPAHVSGNAAAQGIEVGSWAEFIAALKTGVTYANIHSARWPGGEIRGWIGADKRLDNADTDDESGDDDD